MIISKAMGRCYQGDGRKRKRKESQEKEGKRKKKKNEWSNDHFFLFEKIFFFKIL